MFVENSSHDNDNTSFGTDIVKPCRTKYPDVPKPSGIFSVKEQRK